MDINCGLTPSLWRGGGGVIYIYHTSELRLWARYLRMHVQVRVYASVTSITSKSFN